ncbi:MAG: hypothetical protein H6602_10710 [Flavobacteriales bacterium]|nr:hypothetical protein [Flavobacteriales bacterium]
MNHTVFFFLLVQFASVLTASAQEYERYKLLLDTTITSKHLGYDRDITVTVPFEWQQNVDKDFPVVVVFDRQNQRSHNYIINTIDYLTSNEQMPSCIIIGIDSDQEHRYKETLPLATSKNGLAEANEGFLFEELLPLAERRFKASKFRLFIGHSRYGYFTTGLLRSRGNELNGVISLSPFFHEKNVHLTDSVAVVLGTERTSTLYYRFGIGNDYPEDFHTMDSLIHTKRNNHFNVDGKLFKDADHNATPGLVIAPALYDVFEYWSLQQSAYMRGEKGGHAAVQELVENIEAHYGQPLGLSLGVLNGKGWECFNKEQYHEAIEAWNVMLTHYPNFSEAFLYMIEAQLALSEDVTANATEFKKNLATSAMYTEEEKTELLAELQRLTGK